MSWLVRFEIPVVEKVDRLALGQAPAWVTGFALGVAGAERGWFDPIPPAVARWARLVGTAAIVSAALVIGTVGVLGADLDAFAGNGTWQSLVLAAFIVHQIVLVGLVLASHAVVWPPEAEWLAVAVLGVLVSFSVGAPVTRIPVVSRFV